MRNVCLRNAKAGAIVMHFRNIYQIGIKTKRLPGICP